jgi:hypothetical protein
MQNIATPMLGRALALIASKGPLYSLGLYVVVDVCTKPTNAAQHYYNHNEAIEGHGFSVTLPVSGQVVARQKSRFVYWAALKKYVDDVA